MMRRWLPALEKQHAKRDDDGCQNDSQPGEPAQNPFQNSVVEQRRQRDLVKPLSGIFVHGLMAALLLVGVPAYADPPLAPIFTGSGQPALIGQNAAFTYASGVMPEIGAQVTLSGNTGLANKAAVYKIAFTSSVVAGPQSADIYSLNTITHGFYGPGGYLGTGIESDINNMGAHADTLGSTTSAYALVAVSAGNFRSTAGLWVTKSTAEFQHGVAVNSAVLFGFYDYSNSVVSIRVDGTHTTGIDISNATLTYGIALPNNAAIIQKTSAGAYQDVLKLDAVNVLHLGGKPVTYGANDSCGAGYRCMRVPN